MNKNYPQDSSHKFGKWLSNPTPEEEIVVTGLSGTFPNSGNVKEFRNNLFNKVDMISVDGRRWKVDHPDIPQRGGKIPNMEKFDAGFFGIHHRQAHSLDPMCRILLEKTFEAILDAGMHPSELEGTKTGVFIGACFSETAMSCCANGLRPQEFKLTGCMISMLANRISYYYKLKAPSSMCDTACSSSFYALENAFIAMRSGKCDMAIVAGTNACLHPSITLEFSLLGVLSMDAACKSFDDSGNGYVRSEGIVVILLQKSKNARRIYGQIVHMKTNSDGYKEQSITFPSSAMQTQLLQEFYEDCSINPTTLTYLEAHGTGTKIGDPEELNAVDKVFCKNRKSPLLIGSIKSNIGHNEPASGLCAFAKVIINSECNLITPNLHYNKPRAGVEALEQNRLQVVTELTPYPNNLGLIGINSFGFGGSNCHVLFRRHQKHKINCGQPIDDLPRLVCVSGRNDQAITILLDDIKNRQLDVEYLTLFGNIFRKNIGGHLYKGYSILSKSDEITRSSKFFDQNTKQLYVIFGTFGNQWSFAAKQLLALPIFNSSIQKINDILILDKLDIIKILRNGKGLEKPSNLDQILANIAIQIGLVDIFTSLEIKPNATFTFGFNTHLNGYMIGKLTLKETLDGICKRKNFETFDLNQLQNINQNSLILEFGDGRLSNEILAKTITCQSFSNCKSKDNLIILLEIIGSLHEFGFNPKIDKLYPKVDYPVSRGTPMISPLIKWNHSQNWFITTYKPHVYETKTQKMFTICLNENEWSFLSGHIIDGRTLFPATGYLNLAGQIAVAIKGMVSAEWQIVMENCKLFRATNLPPTDIVTFLVNVQKESGYFEVCENDVILANGRAYKPSDISKEEIVLPELNDISNKDNLMKSKDIYKELRLRGYNYKGDFKKLDDYNHKLNKATIEWNGNWISFMDNMLQIKILQTNSKLLYVPIAIKRLVVDAQKHSVYAKSFGIENPRLPVYYYKDIDIIKCGGIEIHGLQVTAIARRKPLGEPVLEKYIFVPYITSLSLDNSIRVNMQIAIENNFCNNLKVIEIVDEVSKSNSQILGTTIDEALRDWPLIKSDITIFSKNPIDCPNLSIRVEDKKIITESDCFLIIGTKLLQRPQLLNQSIKALKPNGYILSREEIIFDQKNLTTENLVILTEHVVGEEKICLIRKKVINQLPITTIKISNDNFNWLSTLQKLTKLNDNLILLAQNDPTNGILGLFNCLKCEANQNNIKCFSIDNSAPIFHLDNNFYKTQLAKNLAINVYQSSKWGSYRHLLLNATQEVNREHCYVNTTIRGDLSSLKWIEGPLSTRTNLQPEQELIHVYYSALNFRDIMVATGRISLPYSECNLGLEYSGRNVVGKKVMGMITTGGLSTLLVADTYLTWPIPDFWTLEDAVTVPVVYATVLYCFFIRTLIKKGQTILIHSGTGGVGQAAIGVALYHGLKVFTTVSTKEKRLFLKKNYPQLEDENIGNSRDTSFEQMIYEQTNGRGVDIVLNSLSEEKLIASIRCLAKKGTFLEIGKFDLMSNNNLQLMLLQKEASFHGVMLDLIFGEEPGCKKLIQKMIFEGIEKGYVKPIVRTIFGSDQIEQGFRFMTTAKHIGKVVIKIREEEKENCALPCIKIQLGLPHHCCYENNSCIIIGGLGGFGLELTQWLIQRGARKIVLSSRKGLSTGYHHYKIQNWKLMGVSIEISTDDVTKEEGCAKLIERANEMGPVEAIFNLAVILEDALLENQCEKNFGISFGPKAVATKHFDVLSRKMCPLLRNFVVFSSVSCGRGNAGQTNYGMANSVMEKICEERKRDGLPALAIQWGAVGDVGLVAEMQEDNLEIVISGTLTQRVSNCLEILDNLLIQNNPIVSSMVVAEKKSGYGNSGNILEVVGNILGISNIKTVSQHAPLAELSMDSMTGVEIKQTLERDFDLFLTADEIRNLTFTKLAEIQEVKTSNDQNPSRESENETKAHFQMIFASPYVFVPPKLDYVNLKTLVDESSRVPKVFFIPGIEGLAKIFENLASQLQLHVTVLQLMIEHRQDTIQDLARNICPLIEDNIRDSKEFNLVAYSFGAVVAIEIAAVLESKGYSGKIVLIDGSPTMSFQLTKNMVEIDDEAIFQTTFLFQILSFYVPYDLILKYKERTLRCRTFDERLDLMEELSPKDGSFSVKQMSNVIVVLYKRLKAVVDYKPSFGKIKAAVKLFKPEQASVLEISEDYDLSNLLEGSCQVEVFKGNHFSILENSRVAKAIQSFILGK